MEPKHLITYVTADGLFRYRTTLTFTALSVRPSYEGGIPEIEILNHPASYFLKFYGRPSIAVSNPVLVFEADEPLFRKSVSATADRKMITIRISMILRQS
jgi:hypothetical protein